MLYHGGNPLARPSDHVEAAILVLAIVLGLLAMPFAAAYASDSYALQEQVSRQQVATRHPGTAVLLADVPVAGSGRTDGSADGREPTAATWALADGTVRIGEVRAAAGARRGAVVDIWVDETGNSVPAPLSHGAAIGNAVSEGLALWTSCCTALFGVYWLVRLLLDRRRLARWQRDWFHDEDRRASS